MPIPESSERGNLYIVFDVQFPPNHFLEDKDFKKLERFLPERPHIKLPTGDHVEEVSLSDFDERRYMHTMGGGGGGREAYHEEAMESDDDEMTGHPGGAQHVQCAQQ